MIRKYGLERTVVAAIVTLSTLLVAPPIVAQESAIGRGVAWLEENQDGSGMSRRDQETPFRGTSVIVVVFSLLNGACIA